MRLGVGDGFRFGCGLILVLFVFYLIMTAIGAVFMVLAMLLGLLPLLLPQGRSLLLLLPLA